MYINDITQNEQQLAQEIDQSIAYFQDRSICLTRIPRPLVDDAQAVAETDRFVSAARIIASNPRVTEVAFSLEFFHPQAIDAFGSVLSYLRDKSIRLVYFTSNAASLAFFDALAQSEVKSCKLPVTHDMLHKLCETLPKMNNLRQLKLSFHSLTQRSSGAVLDALQSCKSLDLLRHSNHGSVRRATVNRLIENIQPVLLANRRHNQRVQAFEALFPGDKPNKLDDRKGHRFLSAFVNTNNAVEQFSSQDATAASEVVGSKLASFLTIDDAISVAKTSKRALHAATTQDTNTYQQVDRLRALYQQR